MATGVEHYELAERLLDVYADGLAAVATESMNPESTQVHGMIAHQATVLAAAQAHATLALVAATVEQAGARGVGDITDEWAAIVWPESAAEERSPHRYVYPEGGRRG